MPVTARYDAEHDLVETTFTGVTTRADVIQEIELTLALIEKHGCTRILSDISRAQLEVSTLDVFQQPDDQESAGSSRAYLIAVIPPPTEAGKELGRFYETVCLNRGWPVKVCSTRQQAIDWLTSD